jgi:2-polyprenyl-3-methyl-5-hydroxy-6-metoxy-1,4-benzoquinol methylase
LKIESGNRYCFGEVPTLKNGNFRMSEERTTARTEVAVGTDAEALEAFLERENLRYQSVPLPGGRTTPGHDRSYLNDLIFDQPFSGRTLLDIGSYLGYFCIEAMRRGAHSAMGVEADPESVRQASEIARICGVNPAYVCGDFEHWDFGKQTFDTVLCLNVLHHMFDPIGVIRQIINLADRRIIFELAQPHLTQLLAASISPPRIGLDNIPLVLLGQSRRSHDILSRSFMITAKAIEVMLNQHTELFEPVIIKKSPFKDRRLIVANKRRIKHLVVISGPTASGKSTFLQRLHSDIELRRKLGLDGIDVHYSGKDRQVLPIGELAELILHYDILRPYSRSIRTYERDPRCDFLKIAEKITLVTLMSPREVLCRRFERSELGFRRRKRKAKRYKELYLQYGTGRFLETWYENWFKYCEKYPQIARNLIYISDDVAARFLPANQWRAECRNLFR